MRMVSCLALKRQIQSEKVQNQYFSHCKAAAVTLEGSLNTGQNENLLDPIYGHGRNGFAGFLVVVVPFHNDFQGALAIIFRLALSHFDACLFLTT